MKISGKANYSSVESAKTRNNKFAFTEVHSEVTSSQAISFKR